MRKLVGLVTLVTLFLMIQSAGGDPVPGVDFSFDSAAEPDFSLHGTIQQEYWIFLMPSWPLIQFRDKVDQAITLANYNWKHQYWAHYEAGFDPSRIDLAKFFTKIDLSKTVLNRDIPGLSPVRPGAVAATPRGEGDGAPPPYPGSAAGEADGEPLPVADPLTEMAWSEADTMAYLKLRRPTWVTKGFGGLKYDVNAVPDLRWNNRVMGKYVVSMMPGFPDIIFRDAAKPEGNLAQYSILQQYWSYTLAGFDKASINLAALFLKIDPTILPLLDRPYPADDYVIRKLPSESKPYDYSKDKDFGDFVKWMAAAKVKEATRSFYIMAGSNPSKRGATLPFFYGALVSHLDCGMEVENFKPISQKGLTSGSLFKDEEMISAGGMQYYFELRKGAYARAVDYCYNLFVDSASVPITIVEADNTEYRGAPQPMLRGAALLKQAEKDIESATRKDAAVSYLKIAYPFSEFNIDFDKVIEKYVLPKAKKGQLFILYFTDAATLKKHDPDMTHPIWHGAYGTDWAKIGFTIIHEFGHALGMRHHFGERVNASSIDAHISPACIMNYKYSSREFCELCRYGLRLKK